MRAVASPVRARRGAQLRIPLAIWLLVLITVGGGLLRFIGLGSQSFWLDEFLTWDFTHKPVDELRGWLRLEPHPPLYFLSAWAWSDVAGDGEFGLRSLSALFGTATIPLVYAAAVTRLSRSAALLAALLVAVSPFAVWYSQEARPYAMLAALCALSLVCLLRALESPRRWAWGWAVASSLALATHYFAGFLIALEALWLLRVHGWRPVWAPLALVLAAELVMVAYLLTGNIDLVNWVRTTPLSDRLERVPVEFITARETLEVASDVATRFWIVAALVLGGVAVACAVRSEWTAARPFLLLGAALILLPLAIAIVKPSSDYFLPRYLIAAQVPLLIVVAAGFAARRLGRAGLVAGVALAGILLSLTLSIASRNELQRPDWQRVGRSIGAAETPRAVVVKAWVASLPLHVYVPRLSLMYKAVETPGLEGGQRQRARAPLEVAEVVLLAVGSGKPKGTLLRGFRLTRWRDLGGAILSTYQAPRPVLTSPGALSAGARRLYPSEGLWQSPLVYFQDAS